MNLSLAVNEEYMAELKNLLDSATGDNQLFEAIVNAPFHDKLRSAMLGLGITVLLLVNKKEQTIDRVALSKTDMAKGTTDITVKPFKAIKIPLGFKGNFIAESIRSGRYQQTSDWRHLFAPDLSPAEARLNQAGGGIECSFVYPLVGARSGGAIIFSYYLSIDKISQEHRNFMDRYSRLAAKSLKK